MPPKSHGRSAYTKRGCRCDICVDAQQSYCQRNKETRKEYSRQYYHNNRDTMLVKMAEYRKNNKDKFKKNTPQRREAHRNSESARRSKVLNQFVEFVDRQVLFERDNYICQSCDKVCDPDAVWPAKDFPTHDHIIPLNKGGEHSYQNGQTLCLPCNLRKSDCL